MTDATQQPGQAQLPPMNSAQIQGVKNVFITALNKAYIEFINAIVQIPVETNGLKNALLFFDTGLFWFEKAVHKMPINQLPVNPQPTENQNTNQEPQEPQAPESPQESKQEGIAQGEPNPATPE